MAEFRIRVDSALPPKAAMEALFDLDAHDRLIPLTRVQHREGPLRRGTHFDARTGVGRLGFDDPMVVEEYHEPIGRRPGRARFAKTGRVVLGTIDVTVSPRQGGSIVDWRQDFALGGVPASLENVVASIAKLAYAPMVRRLLAAREESAGLFGIAGRP